jgi:hypothetical protein
MCQKISWQLQGAYVGMWFMRNLIRLHLFGNETWGQSIKHIKVPNVQPHVLPNLKLYMPSCFVGMFFMSFLSFAITF